MVKNFEFKPSVAQKAFELEGYYVWDCAVIEADGKYHMFSSRWKKEYGFGWNWLFNSEIIHSVSDTPEGPFRFLRVVLPRRGREYFDGMNTHNTCIKEWNGRFYLYYMGTTYNADNVSFNGNSVDFGQEVWNRKRIGVAVADGIYGEFKRQDTPLLEPRDCSHWDCTATTNPAVAILPSGKTYMIYKSRSAVGAPLQLGVAVADKPDGKFERLTEGPILQLDRDKHMEDPYLWYDDKRNKFCMIAKDDVKGGSFGITGEWGSGFYAESDDCIHFEIAKDPKVYSRNVTFSDGSKKTLCNLERPWVLFDKEGNAEYLYNASGNGSAPYAFEGSTFIMGQRLIKK